MAELGLHHCGKFLEPSDEWAGRGCYCFLMRWHSVVGHFRMVRNDVEKLVELKFEFSILTLSMSLRYFGNELYNRGPNTVIAFSWRDCAGFLFVEYWTTHCVSYLGCFLIFFVPNCAINIWHRMLCYLPNIYNYITFTAFLERVQFEFVQSFPVV